MTYIDIAVLLILFLCGFIAWYRGFVKACLSFLPMVAALAASYFLQPIFSSFIRTTPLYASLKLNIAQTLRLEQLLSNQAMNAQAEIISNMNLPSFLKEGLLENNNPVIYNLLDVTTLSDYIAGYIANICINAVTLLALFLLTLLAAKIFLSALNIVASLPVLHFMNKTLGLAVGLLQGLVIIWLCCIALTYFNYDPNWSNFFTVLEASPIALFFYQNNLLIFFIVKIFT